MLTPRQNMLEVIRGGKPERFVKQYEAMAMPYSDPFSMMNPVPFFPGDEDKVDMWGVTWSWPVGTPGMFPVHTTDKKVIDDIEEWDGTLQTPPLEFPEEMWEEAVKDYAQYDRNEFFVGPILFPGLFEQTHCLLGMDDALVAFYTEPEKMHRLIDIILQWQMAYIRQLGARLHPDAVLQHDDWGSSTSTFLSPDMFREFYLEPYKKLYSCFRESGIELIVHHSDSYAATYIPMMIEMGIDVWQGGTRKNDIPSLIKQYGGQISFMTGLEATDVDKEGWTQEDVHKAVWKVCEESGMKYFIPCTTQGGPATAFEGVYEAINAEIDAFNVGIKV